MVAVAGHDRYLGRDESCDRRRAVLAARAVELDRELGHAQVGAVARYVELGRVLREVRPLVRRDVGYGSWENWIRNQGIHLQRAYRAIRVAGATAEQITAATSVRALLRLVESEQKPSSDARVRSGRDPWRAGEQMTLDGLWRSVRRLDRQVMDRARGHGERERLVREEMERHERRMRELIGV